MGDRKAFEFKRRFDVIVIIVIAALIMVLIFTSMTTDTTTDETIDQISEMYLAELSNQTIAYFDASMGGKVSQANTIAQAIASMQVDESGLERYLAEQTKANKFSAFYLVTNDGRCFSSNGFVDALMDRDALLDLVESGPQLLSAEAVPFIGEGIVCADSIEPLDFAGTKFVGIVAAYEASAISDDLVMSRSAGNAHSSIVARDGTYVLYSPAIHQAPEAESMFDGAWDHVTFDKGYTEADVRYA
ncbi:MAG: hypothetical protein RR547_07650, partial [Raoultibacter sp.]